MLVLTRKVGERIIIGDNIVVTLMGVESRNGARIGIDAPDDVAVDREEIRERKDREKENGGT